MFQEFLKHAYLGPKKSMRILTRDLDGLNQECRFHRLDWPSPHTKTCKQDNAYEFTITVNLYL